MRRRENNPSPEVDAVCAQWYIVEHHTKVVLVQTHAFDDALTATARGRVRLPSMPGQSEVGTCRERTDGQWHGEIDTIMWSMAGVLPFHASRCIRKRKAFAQSTPITERRVRCWVGIGLPSKENGPHSPRAAHEISLTNWALLVRSVLLKNEPTSI